MDVDKQRTKKASISPSAELWNEAQRQKDAGVFDSKTDFFETAGWMLVEMQRLGIDMARGLADDESAVRAIEGSAVKMKVEVSASDA